MDKETNQNILYKQALNCVSDAFQISNIGHKIMTKMKPAETSHQTQNKLGPEKELGEGRKMKYNCWTVFI